MDGTVTQGEKQLLTEYLIEMAVDDDCIKSWEKPYDECVENFKQFNKRVQKIMFFELLGMAYSDNEYCIEEKRYLDELNSFIGLTQKKIDSISIYVIMIVSKVYDRARP